MCGGEGGGWRARACYMLRGLLACCFLVKCYVGQIWVTALTSVLVSHVTELTPCQKASTGLCLLNSLREASSLTATYLHSSLK